MRPPPIDRLFVVLYAALGAAWVVDVTLGERLGEPWRRWVPLYVGLLAAHLLARFRLKPPRREDPSLVVDTSAVLDARLGPLLETGLADVLLVVPDRVISELQSLADHADAKRRVRGRRGLELLASLRANSRVRLVVDDRELREYAGKPVDECLIELAKDRGAKLLTGDFNLNKAAQARGVQVVNLNDVARAMRPAFAVGDRLEIDVTRAGEQSGQGVGHLDDGTMVVVEGARGFVGRRTAVVVTGLTQSSAGRMIFARCEGPVDGPVGEPVDTSPPTA